MKVFSFLLAMLLGFPLSMQAKTHKKSFVKKAAQKIADTLESIPIVGGVAKTARKYLPIGSKEDEMVDLLGEQVATSKTALEQMREVAQDMVSLKRKIEAAAALKRQAEQLSKDLSQAKYGKVALGITEKISGISLNPSDYIPSVGSTQEAKRMCSFSFYREKALLGNMDAFMHTGQRFVGKNAGKGMHGLCRDIEQQLLHGEKVKTASKEANHQLIPIYTEQIQALADLNKKIDQALHDPRFTKDPVKRFQLESIKSQNNLQMGSLVEKINQLRKESEEVSKADQKAIGALYSEQLYQAILRHALALKKQRKRKL